MSAPFGMAHLVLLHPLRAEWCLVLLLGAAALVWWCYRRTDLGRRRWLLGALRVAALALLLLAVLRPAAEAPTHDHASGTVLVGVDVSASMALPDGGPSRLDRARAALSGQDGLIARCQAAGAHVRLFAFGTQARELPLEGVPALRAEDQATNIAEAIRTMGAAVRPGTPAALVLLTDANDTTADGPTAAAHRALQDGTPVHVVALGSAEQSPDVAVLALRVPPTVEVGATTPIVVSVARSHYHGPVALKLFQGDTFLASATVPAGEGSLAEASLALVPPAAGALDLRVEAAAVPGETALANNVRSVRVQAVERRLDVLFVEGSPRHEFAFIRRTMTGDRHFRLVTLLRLGHHRWANSANDDSERSDGFPTTAEDLGRYSAVILSDIEAAEFTADQLALLHDFVTVRGGGLLMLGGTNAFNLGGYADTPISAILPVELGPEDALPTFDDRPFAFTVTAAGLDHEILRQGRSRAETEAQWKLMPPLKGLNVLLRAKPGATVLGVRSTPAPESVVLAVQDAGAGRVAAFASANSWRWKMLRAVDDDSFRRFWSQMIRWLAVGNRQLLSIAVDRPVVGVHQTVGITAHVLDATHRPTHLAGVVATLRDAGGHEQQLPMPWILSEDGTYRAEFRPDLPGEITITVEAALAHQPPLRQALSILAVEPARELEHSDPDPATARAIAQAGGGIVALDGSAAPVTEAILAQLHDHAAPVSVVTQQELGDTPWLLVVITALLAGEWALRRRNGLP